MKSNRSSSGKYCPQLNIPSRGIRMQHGVAEYLKNALAEFFDQTRRHLGESRAVDEFALDVAGEMVIVSQVETLR